MIDTAETLAALGIEPTPAASLDLVATSPIDGSAIGRVAGVPRDQIDEVVGRSRSAFLQWRCVPAPRRGELIRLLGNEIRRMKEPLGRLVTLETGKILQEGLGEVQEMIDMCDLAVGLSRQLHGTTIASERSQHAMRETWHPYGPTAIITAFNFPVAVWSWNAALALICGNSIIWKPSDKAPLTAAAVHHILSDVLDRFGSDAPRDLSQLAPGGADIGIALAEHQDVALVSATGSTAMGRSVGSAAAARFARVILELGGNNAMVIAPTADLDLSIETAVFAAVGTAGQRCTSLRRLIVHQDVCDEVLDRLHDAYARLPVGNPLDAGTLVGPLIDADAFVDMQCALDVAASESGSVLGGQRVEVDGLSGGHYVQPALVEMDAQTEIVRQETFAPILYVIKYSDFEDALMLNNDVEHGLSSSLMTSDINEAEMFVSATGSDCGLANINVGPSGAEIGGAFGGEKHTGGGRESGSDAWKGYMRRQTSTVNYSQSLVLAQGISFGAKEPR